AGGQAQGVEPREGGGAVLELLEERGQAELLEVVELVAAGRAVAADTDRHAGPADRHEVGDPGAELQVRARAVDDAEALRADAGQMSLVEPDAVRQAQVGGEHALLGEIFDLILPALEL